jgi:hypothetical protein
MGRKNRSPAINRNFRVKKMNVNILRKKKRSLFDQTMGFPSEMSWVKASHRWLASAATILNGFC